MEIKRLKRFKSSPDLEISIFAYCVIRKYKIRVAKSTLNEIYKKVRNFPWCAAQNMNGWEYGTNLNYLKSISKYWITKYNWKKFENKINSFKNYKTKVAETILDIAPNEIYVN